MAVAFAGGVGLMLSLLFIGLPAIAALFTLLLGRYRQLVLWTATVTVILEAYLCAHLPLGQPFHLFGTVLSLTALDRLFLYTFMLAGIAILLVAQWLHQGDLPVPIGLFILGVTNAIILLDDPIVIALLLEVVGLAIVLGTVDRPQEPVGLLPVSALMAGLKYLTMMILAGITLVMGFLMLGLFAEAPQEVVYAKFSLGLIVTGFGLGTAVVPFHLWFPDLAEHTSTAVTGLLVALVQGTALFFLGRFFLGSLQLLQENPRGVTWLTTGALVAAVAAALLAIGQDRWKRLVAFAASFDIALILYAFGQGSGTGLQDGFLLLFHHELALTLLLLCVGVLEWSAGRDDVAGLVGVAYRLPMVALGLIVATLSLAGIPPFGGFVGRWALLMRALEQGWLYLVGLVVSLAILLLAMVRALWPILLPTEQTVSLRRPPWPVSLVIAALIIGLLLAGLYPHLIFEVIRGATTVLAGL
jgi:multicomponent Na+:H+ antiporter subunit D